MNLPADDNSNAFSLSKAHIPNKEFSLHFIFIYTNVFLILWSFL